MKRPEFSPGTLTLIHRPRDDAGNGFPPGLARQWFAQGFYAATCMRELVVLPGATTPRELLHTWPREGAVTIRHDAAAYAFLVQTITGLNSSIPGETNVQGQLRKAWSRWRHEADARLVRALSPVVHCLFNDAGDIRRQYLEGIGGNSYGSLVRKLLQPGNDDRVLFVGAGDLAHSMLPFFSHTATGVWSRHSPDADFAPATRRFVNRESALAWATQVVMTTPPDTGHDLAWAELCAAARLPVVHLGRRRAAPGDWMHLEHFSNLDDIFDLRRSQSSLRSLQIVRAKAACEHLGRTRYTCDRGDVLVPLSAASA